jgi:hypothetical protein
MAHLARRFLLELRAIPEQKWGQIVFSQTTYSCVTFPLNRSTPSQEAVPELSEFWDLG